MAPQDELLVKLCQSEETLKGAKSLLRIAQQKTAPGSGFELGPRKTGLPAICAYIASHRLNNTEVTRNTAQVASCLKRSDFDKALLTVEAAIGDARKEKGKRDVYAELFQQYQPDIDRRQFLEWLAAMNRALIQSQSGLDADNSGEGSEVKYAIFFWTYNVVTGKAPMNQQEFAHDQHISSRTLSKLLTRLTSCGSSVKARIQETATQTKASRSSSPKKTPVTTPRRSPKKPLRVLPTKDSPTKAKVAAVEEPPSPPSEHLPPAQNGTESELDLDLLQTPSRKRRRIETPKANAGLLQQNLPSTSKSIHSPKIAFSRAEGLEANADDLPTIQAPCVPSTPKRSRRRDDTTAMDVDSNNRAANPASNQLQRRKDEDIDQNRIQQRRRFRPVYQDHKQWYALDKRVKRIWRQAERYKEQMIEKYGHPLECLRA